MTKQKLKKTYKKFVPIFLSLILVILIFITFQVIFENRFLPRVFIGDTSLTFLTKPQSYHLLDAKYNQRLQTPLLLLYNNEEITLDLATSSAQIKLTDTINQAFEVGHERNLDRKILSQLKLLIFSKTVVPEITFSLDKQITSIAKQVYKVPQDAKLTFEEEVASVSAQIQISGEVEGLELDKFKLEGQIKKYIFFSQAPLALPVKVVKPKITTQKAQKAKKFIEEASKDPINLTFENETFTIDLKTLITLLNLELKNPLDKEKLKVYLSNISQKIDQPVIEGQFNFDPVSQRVIQFEPSQEGRKLDIGKTATLISLALEGKRAKNITLPVTVTQPKIKTSDVNSLGIKELLGRGISHFTGSIPNRIYNINLAASRINGILIPPGEIFSFNDKVGDISASSGYKQAYIIKSGRTVLDDGGGVCQDSTTLFRAVLNAGLPVVARTAHAYRVGYYEQGFPPGLDATVFTPSVDFKFKNDTPAHMLIQAYTSGNTLYVDLYGTADGRVSSVSKPTVTNSTPPPPELRQDDPTLLRGEVKQVDFPAWGANVLFTRKVIRGGETLISETFKSNYKQWAAVFLVGTKDN